MQLCALARIMVHNPPNSDYESPALTVELQALQ